MNMCLCFHAKEQDVESLGDLKMLMKQGLLKEGLQHNMIFAMIKDALENDDGSLDVELDDISKETAQTKQDLATTTTHKQTAQTNELPPNKLFGAFISHKKVQ